MAWTGWIFSRPIWWVSSAGIARESVPRSRPDAHTQKPITDDHTPPRLAEYAPYFPLEITELACGSQAFIATLLFDPSMSALPIIPKQNSVSVGLFTH